MTEINMKNLLIAVHFISCKQNGFCSDDFKAALEKEFHNEYKLKLFDGFDNGGMYEDGTTDITLESVTYDGEVFEIRKRIKNVFLNLSTDVSRRSF